jgi:hypothetical protein
MKIKDIINEQHGNVGSLQPEVARALPNAISFLDLPNQDPYLQYRFGLALASALAVKNGEVVFDSTSAFGENLTVVARTEAEEEIVRLAQQINPRGRRTKLVSTRTSEEAADVNKQSPVRTQNRTKKKKQG